MYKTSRYLLVPMVCAALLLAGGALGLRDLTQRAFAEEARVTATGNYRAAKVWRAEIVERELIADNRYRTVRHRISVAGAGRYRIDSTERDMSGRQVVSTTIADESTIHILTPAEDSRTRVHIIRNAPPTLGAVLDTVLGRQVADLTAAPSVRMTGRDRVAGRNAHRLQIAPGHHIWLDAESGIPLKEQRQSGDTVTYEVEVRSFSEPASIPAADLSISQDAQGRALVEDLGFRSCESPAKAEEALGFLPAKINLPSAWKRTASGYQSVTPKGHEASGEGRWVERFEGDAGCLLVTQVRLTAESGGERPQADAEGSPDTAIEVSGVPVRYSDDGWISSATFRIGNVRVMIEGTTTRENMIQAIEAIL